MPAPGNWTICLPRPDGQLDCQDIPVQLWPTDIDIPDPVIKKILDQMGRLQALTSEVTEPTLKMQLTQAMDAAVSRVGPLLPAGYEFRRAARHDAENEGLAIPVPNVVGVPSFAGWAILNDLGFLVNQQFVGTDDEKKDGFIFSQSPGAGTPAVPPGPVTIWVNKLFSEPPDPGPVTG
jgi:hypothetical protein